MEFLLNAANRGSISTEEFEIENSYLVEQATTSGTHTIAIGSDYGSYTSTKDNKRKFTVAGWFKFNKCRLDDSYVNLFHISGSTSENLQITTDWHGDPTQQTKAWGSSTIRTHFLDTASWFHIMMQVDTTNASYGTSDPSTSPDARGRVKVWINGVHKQWDNHLDNHRSLPGYNHYPGGSSSTDNSDFNNLLINQGTAAQSFYIADFHYLDNTIADATDFGEFNSNGTWIPIETSFTAAQYGSSGTHLEFKQSGESSNGQTSSGLGADTSGNNNHVYIYQNSLDFVEHPQKTDTPTNNFCTLNPLSASASNRPILFKGGLRPEAQGGAYTHKISHALSSGKWYFEVKMIVNANLTFGVCNSDAAIPIASTSENGFMWLAPEGEVHALHIYANSAARSYKANNGSNSNTTSGTSSFANNIGYNDICMVAIDLDDGKLYFGREGSWTDIKASQNPATGANAAYYWIADFSPDGTELWTPFVSALYNQDCELNFGNPPYTVSSGNADANGYGNFEFEPPSGFYAICSKNMAEFDPPDVDDPSEHFQTDMYKATSGGGDEVLFDGNSDLQPDMIFAKSETTAYWWQVHDSSRGATNGALYPNLPNAEGSYGIDSFMTDGYKNAADNTAIQAQDETIHSFGWKAGGGTTTSVSQSGSGASQILASTYQANTDGGFSICTWSGSGSVGKITHGLGAVPAVIVTKRRGGSNHSWAAYHKDTGVLKSSLSGTNAWNHYMEWDSHYGQESTTAWWNDTAPDSNYFTIGSNSDDSGQTYVAYVWAEKKGLSKFGHYVGNGNNDGPFCYTGFLPAMVILKGVDHANGWFVFSHDMAIAPSSYVNRSNEGVRNRHMELWTENTTASSNSTHGRLEVAFLSNGFKIQDSSSFINGSGKNSIYYAFAARPFVSSSGTMSPANAQEMVASAGGNTFTGTA